MTVGDRGEPAQNEPVEKGRDEALDPPPVLRTWRNLYVFLAVELAVTVLVLFLLTRWAS